MLSTDMNKHSRSVLIIIPAACQSLGNPREPKGKHGVGLLNEQCDHGERSHEEEEERNSRCAFGSVTQVSGAAFQAVVRASAAHVASHAVFADQIVHICAGQRQCGVDLMGSIVIYKHFYSRGA